MSRNTTFGTLRAHLSGLARRGVLVLAGSGLALTMVASALGALSLVGRAVSERGGTSDHQVAAVANTLGVTALGASTTSPMVLGETTVDGESDDSSSVVTGPTLILGTSLLCQLMPWLCQ